MADSKTPGHTPEATVGTALTKYDIISGRIVNNGVYVAEEEVASEPVLMYNNHNQNLHNAQYSHLRVLFCFDAAFLTLIGTLTTIKPADTQ